MKRAGVPVVVVAWGRVANPHVTEGPICLKEATRLRKPEVSAFDPPRALLSPQVLEGPTFLNAEKRSPKGDAPACPPPPDLNLISEPLKPAYGLSLKGETRGSPVKSEWLNVLLAVGTIGPHVATGPTFRKSSRRESKIGGACF